MTALVIEAWDAWAPALPDRQAWQTWLARGGPLDDTGARPKLKEVPAMIRRRCGNNARMVMASALGLCEAAGFNLLDCHLVYGSPNGENHALAQLLEDLCVDEALSPTAFTNSLHHVPTGYLSIVTGHKGVSRTISAFEDTFPCVWLDACGLLKRQQEPALLILSDEIPPPPFDQMLAVPPFNYGVSILVRPARPGEPGIVCERAQAPTKDQPSTHEQVLFNFLKWYDSQDTVFTAQTSFGALTWKKQ